MHFDHITKDILYLNLDTIIVNTFKGKIGTGDLSINSLSFVIIMLNMITKILSIFKLNIIIYQPTMFTR